MSNYITGSKVTAQMYAPGGLQLNGIYDTTTTPISTIVQTFGSSNIVSLQQAIEQRTPDNRNVIATTTRTIYSTTRAVLGNRDYTRIDRVTEPFFRSPVYGQITASGATAAIRTATTASMIVEVDPERGSSLNDAIRDLYTISASADAMTNEAQLRKTISLQDYRQHIKTNENFKREIVLEPSEVIPVVFANATFGKSVDALDAVDSDFADNTKFLSGSRLYNDSNLTTPHTMQPGYLKVKGQVKAYGVWRSGKIIDVATGADKDSQRDFAAEWDINIVGYDTQNALAAANIDESMRRTMYFFNGQFFNNEYLIGPFEGNQKWYLNYKLNEYTRIDNNGQPMESVDIN